MDRHHRETGLVALQAAVRPRRIVRPAARRGARGPEHGQIRWASPPAEGGDLASGSSESLAAQLSLDREEVHALLFSLHSRGHLEAVADEQAEQEGEMPRFTLTAKGRAAVDRYLERAARFLPGWPPHAADDGE